MSSPRKIIAVFGATGAQGGSVARSMLANSATFEVRAITRNPDSESAKALASIGAVIVKADGFKQEEILEAFKGCWGVFLNTNSDDPAFEEPNKKPTEFDLGCILVDSAAEAGIQHVVYSSAPSSDELTGGMIKLEAMEMKNGIEKRARSNPAFSTVIACNAGWYLENFLVPELGQAFGGFPSVVDAEGFLTWKTPYWGGPEAVPWISVADDYGDLVHGIFLDPEKWNGKIVHGVSDIASFDKIVEAFQEVTHKKSRFVALPSWEDFETYGEKFLETTKLVFAFTQMTGGLYFGNGQPEANSATELKRSAFKAMGKKEEDATLITVKQWFEREFAGQAN